MIGVEIGAATKNIIAIAAGVVEGLGLGHNALAALITRGLAELTRLACAAGGRRETLAGLSGLGDLVLTCTGSLSRNRHVGIELARGRTLADILASMKMVAEGVITTGAALALGAQYGVELPIATQMAEVLSGRVGRPHRARRADAAQAACGGRNGAPRRRGGGVMDRRKFLAGGLGATLLASFPADLWAGTVQAPAPATWDPGRVVASAPDRQRYRDAHQGVVYAAADERTDAANRAAGCSRTRDRHTTAVLAVPCGRPGSGPPIRR